MIATTSLWEQESFFAPSDVIIVGSGLLGLWTALEIKLRKPSTLITIIDRGVIPIGASTRNAGFACFGSPGEMISDAKTMGEEQMWQLVEMRYRGIQKIRKHFGDTEIGFDAIGGYECFNATSIKLEEIKDRLSWINSEMEVITGVSNTFKWCSNKMNGFGLHCFDALIENQLEGGIHSGKLVLGLIKKLQALGVTILQGIDVSGWEKGNLSIEVQTSTMSLQTQQLIICTNGMLSTIAKDLYIEPARGQVLVTSPINQLLLKGTFHFDEGYFYFRNVGNRVLIGGARNMDREKEKSNDFLLNDNIQQELEQFLKRHILQNISYTITHRWSGIMGFTSNKLPLVTKLEEDVYAAICCNGMGVALSPIIAEEIFNDVFS